MASDARQRTGRRGAVRRWPQGWGFDHWWGFLSGAAGQYDPIITQDNGVIGVPEGKGDKPYYFPDDLTDKAVEWLNSVRAQDAHQTRMMYYSTGATHAPHHVLKEWADKYKASSTTAGTSTGRRRWSARRSWGIVPPDTELTERPDLFPAWDTLSNTEKNSTPGRWRFSPASRRTPTGTSGVCSMRSRHWVSATNTLVIYIWGDNGASMEGHEITGSFNEMTFLNGVVLEPDQQIDLIEQYGGIEETRRRAHRTALRCAWATCEPTHRSSGASRWPATSAALAIRW